VTGDAAARARIAFVVSTFDWPEALDAVLRGFADQSDPDFSLIVADDGSGAETRAVIDRWATTFGGRLVHAWQEDGGFRLARVLNLGALAADADYYAFLHGESVPRRHFARAIRSSIRRGWFVAGRRIELSRRLTDRVLHERLPVHTWNLADWLRVRHDAAPLGSFTRRDRRRVGVRGVPEFLPHNRSYGYLLGVWRTDFERVNGYDMRFEGWGEEDVDIAIRLRRIGLRCGHAGPHATLIHLWHESNVPGERLNWYLLQETERTERIDAVEGIRELARSTGHTTAWVQDATPSRPARTLYDA
jgi:glycosyltransferase involved in cell wall biosynthesis